MIEFQTGKGGMPLCTIHNLRLLLKEYVSINLDGDKAVFQVGSFFTDVADISTEDKKTKFIDFYLKGNSDKIHFLEPISMLYLDNLIHHYELPIEIKKYLPLFKISEFYDGDL